MNTKSLLSIVIIVNILSLSACISSSDIPAIRRGFYAGWHAGKAAADYEFRNYLDGTDHYYMQQALTKYVGQSMNWTNPSTRIPYTMTITSALST